jgi:hypothetical protein
MQSVSTIPSAEGQICKIINVFEDENPEDLYIVVEDPSIFDEDESIYVVNLKDLQRNINSPELAPQISIVKNDLIVVANNMNDYFKSVNSK